MNVRESKFTRILFSDQEKRKQIKKQKSVLGTKFVADGKNYIVTNGNTDKVEERVQNLKKKLNELSSE